MYIGWCSRGWAWFSSFCGVSARLYQELPHSPCTHRCTIIGYFWWLRCIGCRCSSGWFPRRTYSMANAYRACVKRHWPVSLPLSTCLPTSIYRRWTIARRWSHFTWSCSWRTRCWYFCGWLAYGPIDPTIGMWRRCWFLPRSSPAYCSCCCTTATFTCDVSATRPAVDCRTTCIPNMPVPMGAAAFQWTTIWIFAIKSIQREFRAFSIADSRIRRSGIVHNQRMR